MRHRFSIRHRSLFQIFSVFFYPHDKLMVQIRRTAEAVVKPVGQPWSLHVSLTLFAKSIFDAMFNYAVFKSTI